MERATVPTYTATQQQAFTQAQAFYTGSLALLGITETPQKRDLITRGTTPADLLKQYLKGIYVKGTIGKLLAVLKPKSIRAQQHDSISGDSSSAFYGTIGLATCSALVYIRGNTVVLGHIAPIQPNILDQQRIGGEVRTSMQTQEHNFQAAMASSGLTGTEADGHWILVRPTGESANLIDDTSAAIVTFVTNTYGRNINVNYPFTRPITQVAENVLVSQGVSMFQQAHLLMLHGSQSPLGLRAWKKNYSYLTRSKFPGTLCESRMDSPLHLLPSSLPNRLFF
jgi:hypothetical protein